MKIWLALVGVCAFGLSCKRVDPASHRNSETLTAEARSTNPDRLKVQRQDLLQQMSLYQQDAAGRLSKLCRERDMLFEEKALIEMNFAMVKGQSPGMNDVALGASPSGVKNLEVYNEVFVRVNGQREDIGRRLNKNRETLAFEVNKLSTLSASLKFTSERLLVLVDLLDVHQAEAIQKRLQGLASQTPPVAPIQTAPVPGGEDSTNKVGDGLPNAVKGP